MKIKWSIKKDDILVLVFTALCLLAVIAIEILELNFTVLSNILYSSIAAGFFYAIQIVLPREVNCKKAVKLLSKRIKKLYDTVATFCAIVAEFMKIRDDTVIIHDLHDNLIYYHIKYEKTAISEYKNLCNYLTGYIGDIKKQAREIENCRFSSYLPDNFLEQIDLILENEFSMIKAVGEGYPDCPKYIGLEKDLERMKRIKKDLLPFLDRPYSVNVTKMTEKEILAYKSTLKAARGFIQTMNEKALKRQIARGINDPLNA